MKFERACSRLCKRHAEDVPAFTIHSQVKRRKSELAESLVEPQPWRSSTCQCKYRYQCPSPLLKCSIKMCSNVYPGPGLRAQPHLLRIKHKNEWRLHSAVGGTVTKCPHSEGGNHCSAEQRSYTDNTTRAKPKWLLFEIFSCPKKKRAGVYGQY